MGKRLIDPGVTSVNRAWLRAVDRFLADEPKWNGSLTLHVQNGEIQKLKSERTLRLVDFSEADSSST